MKWKKYHPNQVIPHTYVLARDELGNISVGKFDSVGAFHDDKRSFIKNITDWTLLDLPKEPIVHEQLKKSIFDFQEGNKGLGPVFMEILFAIEALEEKINELG